MIKFLVFILQIAVLAALTLWLSDRPGTARIVWHDTVIETSAAFLGVCVLAVAYALHLILRLWHFLRHGPVHWRLRRKISKIQQGQDQLAQGLVALAGGHAAEAGRLAVAARKNLGASVAASNNFGATVAAQWLQAQAAQLAGDHGAARDIFRVLAARDDSAVLGYRGLINEAKRAGQWDEIDRLVTELHHLKPATPWLSLIRMESAARRGQWAEAEQALSHAAAARLLDSTAGRRRRAALRIAASREAAAAGDSDAALRAAEQAAQQAPDWLPATINLAESLKLADHPRAARRVLERAWKTMPHPMLAQILRDLSRDALDAFKQTESLCRSNQSTIESSVALAQAALDAQIWGEARRYLMACIDTGAATQGVYKMLAQLERGEHRDERAAAGWLAKLSDVPADPQWLCQTCGHAHKIWQPVCIACGAFDSVEWRKPGESRAALNAPLPESADHD